VVIGAAAVALAQNGQPSSFDRLDTNRDGFVDRQEFQQAAFGQRNPGLFDELDADKDGKVSREESNRVRGGRPQGLEDLPPAREVPATPIPKPDRPGEPALKTLGDFDAVRDAAGRGQMFEAAHAAGFTNLQDSTNGIALVDINRDGWVDIVATYSPRRGTTREGGVERLRVLLNDGNWNFREHTITLKNSKVALNDFGRGQVPVLADFNRDGFLDLFVTRNAAFTGGRNVSGRSSHGNSLFISDGAWDVFRDVSDQMGIRNEEAYNRQPSIGDVNKDGWLDIAVGCDNIGNAMGGVPHSRLYIFQPKGDRFEDGTFKDIGGTDLVPDFGGFYHDSAKDKAGPNIVLRDADNDGDLDLFQSFHVDVREPLLPYSPGEYRQGVFCWKNLLAEIGTLRFEKVTSNGLAVEARLRYNREKQVYEPATDARAPGLPYLFLADVDNDGLQDVFTTGPSDTTWSPRSEYVGGRFWRNLGGFRFQETTQAAGLSAINNTYRQWYEFFDLPVTAFHRNFRPREAAVLGQPGMTPTNPIDNRPYYADGVFADYNNDGWQDLVVLDRRNPGRIETRAVLFMNKGDGTFEPKPTTFSGIDAGGIAGEAADLNNDGLLDIVFAADPDNSGVATDTSQYESRVYWNTGEHGEKQNHWLRMRFTGVTDAQLIGARVEAVADGRKQYRWITVSQSYKSGGALEAHFGLAGSKSADITVTLLDGRTIAVPDIASDRYVEIDVAKKTVTPVQAARAASTGASKSAAPVPAMKLDIADTVFELVVRDATSVTKFYRDGLGMREVEAANQQTGAVLEWAGSYLKIRPVAGAAPAAPPRNPIRQMIASNGYRWFSMWYTDPEAMSQRLVQQGYPAPSRFTNVWMTRDPEGNLVELMGIPREATAQTLSWGMTVSDNDAARAFWGEVLGLKEYRPWTLPGVPKTSGGDGASSMMMYVFQGGPGVVKFSSLAGVRASEAAAGPDAPGLRSVTLRVRNFDAVRPLLKARGAKAQGGGRWLLTDPDGNRVVIEGVSPPTEASRRQTENRP
jgi:catechol 2,3-dioxygenase-like lactoylglutathione lyase family enzyme